MTLEERFVSASREELLEHVLVQRDLIQRLHRRILDLETALAEEYALSDRKQGGSQYAPSPADRHQAAASEAHAAAPIRSAMHPPLDPGDLPRGVDEINRVLDAHSKGRPTLPSAVVAELLFIRQQLLTDEDGDGDDDRRMQPSLLREYSSSRSVPQHRAAPTSQSNANGSTTRAYMFPPPAASLSRTSVQPRWVSADASRIVYSLRQQSSRPNSISPLRGSSMNGGGGLSPMSNRRGSWASTTLSPGNKDDYTGELQSPPPLLPRKAASVTDVSHPSALVQRLLAEHNSRA